MLHTIHAIVEKESTESLNLDHITIKDYPKDKKLYQDHTVEYFVQVVLNQESLEPSF
jgi:hypothetical protein